MSTYLTFMRNIFTLRGFVYPMYPARIGYKVSFPNGDCILIEEKPRYFVLSHKGNTIAEGYFDDPIWDHDKLRDLMGYARKYPDYFDE